MSTEFIRSILIFRHDFLTVSFIIGRHIHRVRSLSGGIERFPFNIISLDSINEDNIVLFNFKSDYSLAKRGFEIWYQTGKYSVFDIVKILNHLKSFKNFTFKS